jgi:hypothetical protein
LYKHNSLFGGWSAGRKTIVMTLVDREGDAIGVVVPDTKKETLEAVAKPIVDKSATIMTDGNPSYASWTTTSTAIMRSITTENSFGR